MISRQDIEKIMTQKGHLIFKSDAKAYNLNYIGIRDMGGQWNDQFILMWKYNGHWSYVTWMGTTDPGAYYLKHPLNVNGTAILPEGQHRGMFKSGKHQGRYTALVQAREIEVYRDGDKDKTPELNSLTLYKGWHGINSHRAHTKFEVTEIGKYSAGCQVTHNIEEYRIFMYLTGLGFKYWGKTLTYTLLNINDF